MTEDLSSILKEYPFDEEMLATSNDPELLKRVLFYMACRSMQHLPRFQQISKELMEWLCHPETVDRIYAGVSDPCGELRGLCVAMIVRSRHPGFEELAKPFFSDADPAVRSYLCEALKTSGPVPIFERPLIEAALHDPDYNVRGMACEALANYPPENVIPVFIKMIQTDNVADKRSGRNAPGDRAADVLDKILGTNWMATHLPDGLATLPPGNPDVLRLIEQAELELRRISRR